jgi:menaquinone-dependent protoporphyrinogen oxidase
MIGDTLEGDGCEVDVRDARRVDDIAHYDAVVLGGALYAGRWQRDARRFGRRFRRTLSTIPVWLFSSGPLDGSATRAEILPARGVAALAERIGARGHATFGGCLTPASRGWLARRMAATAGGDFRDQDQIIDWAANVAEELTREPHPASTHIG